VPATEPSAGIEDADAVTFAVHDVEALGERFVDDGVWLLAYFDFGKGFEAFSGRRE